MCLDRYNQAIQQVITVLQITPEHIELVLTNPNISFSLKAAYINLCRVIFIDIDPYLSISSNRVRCFY